MHKIVYPEKKFVSDEWLLRKASDYLATEYMKQNPGVDPASGAIEANSKVVDVDEAKDILDSAGLITLARY